MRRKHKSIGIEKIDVNVLLQVVFTLCHGGHVGAHLQKNLMNFFCYVHQHGWHGLCHLSPTGLKVM